MLSFTINHLISSIRAPIDQLQLISYLLRIGNEEKNSFVNSPIDVLCPRVGVFPFFPSNSVVFGWIVATFQLQPTYLSDFKRVFFFVFDFFNWWLSLFHSVRANDKTCNFTEKNITKSYQSFIVWTEEYLVLNWFLGNQRIRIRLYGFYAENVVKVKRIHSCAQKHTKAKQRRQKVTGTEKKRNFSFVDIHPMRDDSCENKYLTVNRPSCQRQQPQRIVTWTWKKKNSSTTGFYLIPTSLSSRGPKYSVCTTICDMNKMILYFGKVVEKKKKNLKINKSKRSKRACACVCVYKPE